MRQNDIVRDIFTVLEAAKRAGTKERDPVSGQMVSHIRLSPTVVPDFMAITLRIPDPTFFQPAVDFQKEHALTDIAGRYVLPEGLSAHDLQVYALLLLWGAKAGKLTAQQAYTALTEVSDVLIDLNSQLKKVSYDTKSPMHTYHLVMGVASAFNTKDMEHFINTPKDVFAGEKMSQSPEFTNLTKAFNYYAAAHQKGGMDMKWVAAPEILRQIEKQLAGKMPPPAPSPPKIRFS